jgi:predicted nucleic acid-binding protein
VRALIDTNIALDFLLEREPFIQDAEMLFQAIDDGEVVGSKMVVRLVESHRLRSCCQIVVNAVQQVDHQMVELLLKRSQLSRLPRTG